MFRRSELQDLVQTLKLDILDLKKELAFSKEDNQLLKVRIRKLENEVSKRDRQIETLLDPRKSTFVRKVMSERGASVLINLRERNLKLEKTLLERDVLIKRLQNDVQIKKLYTVKTGGDKKRNVSRQTESSKCDIHLPYYERNRDSDSEKEDDGKSPEHCLKSISMYNISQGSEKICFHSHSARSTAMERAASADRIHHDRLSNKGTNNDTKAQYDGLSRDHLLSIIESLKNNQRRLSPLTRKGGSPASDLERTELLCDTPQLEMQQLQNYFMDMLSEVDQLKSTIADLKIDQDKTVHLLKQKDCDIVKLAREIKGMKRPKSKIKSPSYVTPSASNSTRSCTKQTSRSVNNSRNAQVRSYINAMVEDGGEEEEINVYDHTEAEELKPQQKEDGLQIIQTRTMSIQTFEVPSSCNGHQTPCAEGEFPCDLEEKARKEKFDNLMEQMLHETGDTKCSIPSAADEDNDLEAEYI